MARVFSAVDIEDETVLEELGFVRDRIDLGFRTVPEDRMHITLQFFQDVNESRIEELKHAIDNVDLEPFSIDISGVGVFPSRDHIRVVWAGAEDGKMFRLHDKVSRHDLNDDSDHDFLPHVTLLRVRDLPGDKKKKVRRTLEEFENHSFGEIYVNSVKLFRSCLKSSGPVHELLHEAEL